MNVHIITLASYFQMFDIVKYSKGEEEDDEDDRKKRGGGVNSFFKENVRKNKNG